jgi:uncharacterized protein (TIGR00661 family)
MKILYAIQGTGNGHISRAVDIIPELKKYGSLDIFVSGSQADLSLPFPVKYTSKGLSFYFGKRGGIDFIETFRKNSTREIVNEIDDFPINKYDLVINDFEPISAWASKKRSIPCIALSHQAAFLSKKTPRPKSKDPFGEWILRNYAPCDEFFAFHFEEYDKHIYTPVIRQEIRNQSISNDGHYTVYLPAYEDKKLVKYLLKFKSTKWDIFSKTTRRPFHVGKISVYPVNNEKFIESVTSSEGVICGAGFETPSEVLYMNKKLLLVPMKSQYEQKCNAAALKKMGVPVLKKLQNKSLDVIEDWLINGKSKEVKYPDITASIVEKVFKQYEKMT